MFWVEFILCSLVIGFYCIFFSKKKLYIFYETDTAVVSCRKASFGWWVAWEMQKVDLIPGLPSFIKNLIIKYYITVLKICHSFSRLWDYVISQSVESQINRLFLSKMKRFKWTISFSCHHILVVYIYFYTAISIFYYTNIRLPPQTNLLIAQPESPFHSIQKPHLISPLIILPFNDFILNLNTIFSVERFDSCRPSNPRQSTPVLLVTGHRY